MVDFIYKPKKNIHVSLSILHQEPTIKKFEYYYSYTKMGYESENNSIYVFI